MRRIRLVITAAILLSCLPPVAGAGVVYSEDFSSGFFDSGWQGRIDDLTTFTDVNPNTDPRFQIVSGAAQISVDNVYHLNSLLRQIDLTAASGPLSLSLDFDWAPSSIPGGDIVSMNLEGVAGVTGGTIKLLDGFSTFDEIAAASGIADIDVSAAAGQIVDLTLNLVDFSSFVIGDPPDDLLTIDNIVIEQPDAIPVMATVWLLGPGLFALLGLSRRFLHRC